MPYLDPSYFDPQIERIIRDVMWREGWRDGKADLINRAADKGGLTRGGITATSWGAFRRLDRPATAEELTAISDAEALMFYGAGYVRAPKFDRLLDQRLRALVVDWSVTSGQAVPWKAVQRSLLARGYAPGAIDGVPGPQTFAAVLADRDPRALFRDVFNARVRFYLDLAWDAQVEEFLKTHPTSQLANARGWVFRCLEFTP